MFKIEWASEWPLLTIAEWDFSNGKGIWLTIGLRGLRWPPVPLMLIEQETIGL